MDTSFKCKPSQSQAVSAWVSTENVVDPTGVDHLPALLDQRPEELPIQFNSLRYSYAAGPTRNRSEWWEAATRINGDEGNSTTSSPKAKKLRLASPPHLCGRNQPAINYQQYIT
jgi:hypothetical protein